MTIIYTTVKFIIFICVRWFVLTKSTQYRERTKISWLTRSDLEVLNVRPSHFIFCTNLKNLIFARRFHYENPTVFKPDRSFLLSSLALVIEEMILNENISHIIDNIAKTVYTNAYRTAWYWIMSTFRFNKKETSAHAVYITFTTTNFNVYLFRTF